MNDVNYEEIWTKLYHLKNSQHPNFRDITKLIPKLDMKLHTHKGIVDFMARIAVERNCMDQFVKMMVDHKPYYDANKHELIVGHATLRVKIDEQTSEDTVTLKLCDVPIRRSVEERYRPLPLSFKETDKGYVFLMPYRPYGDHLYMRYISWFRAFHQHYVMDNQPHGIEEQYPIEYTKVSIYKPGCHEGFWSQVSKNKQDTDSHVLWLCVLDDHVDDGHHAGPVAKERRFLL